MHRTWILLASLAVALATPACLRGGGCPWISTSSVTVADDAGDAVDCIDVHVPRGDGGDEATGGCVDPVLTGVNRCSRALTVASDGETTVVQPGAPFSIEIPLDAGRHDTRDDVFNFEVPALLGHDHVTFSFQTSSR